MALLQFYHSHGVHPTWKPGIPIGIKHLWKPGKPMELGIHLWSLGRILFNQFIKNNSNNYDN